MTKEIAIHNLFALKLRSRVLSDKDALEMAIKALEQTARIAKLVNELDLAEILPKDYDNIFYLQSVKEIKEEMWRMYRFAEDVSCTLNL